jgi:pilus assembly protein CpaB
MINSLSGKMGASRSWAIAIGIGAAVLAGILLLVYLNRYRDSVAGETAPTSVLVAKSLIVKGTSGTQIATKELYQGVSLPNKEVKVGALADPAYLNGRVAVSDILPGQQLTTSDFTTATTTLAKTKITGRQRALSVAVDNVHGSTAQIEAGDRIDIYIATGARNNGQAIVKLFRQNVLVLQSPTTVQTDTGEVSSSSSDGGPFVLRVDTRDAADFAYAADNTQFWFVIRPQTGARPTRPDTASIATVVR